DDKKVKRLGENTIRPVDVRIIAATNIDIEKAIKTGEFREDLYYRLSVIRCHVPPLRDRLQDLKELSNFFISTFTNDPELKLSEAELTRLMDYRWPGNIRELKNIIERSIILRNNPQLRPSKLLGDMHPLSDITGSELHDNSQIITLAELEKDYITKALNSFANNQSQTARALGISRSTLKRKIKAYQFKSPVAK
ncbi:MAG: AAA family ATPase, partial [Deltaproteobacteria bacterium]|nr:AAA family ATPase [Deltaproteobacteria bacterium]